MLNTMMALWNQNPAENRQRTGKILLTLLFIGISLFLLLFSFSSSAWSLFVGAEGHQLKKEKPPEMSRHQLIATAGNTPVVAIASVGITPTITPTSTRTTVQPCTQAPIVVVQPTVPAQKIAPNSGHHALRNWQSKRRLVHRPKVMLAKKAKPHVGKRPELKVVRPSVQQATATVVATPSPTPEAIASVQIPVVPVVAASATATPVVVEATVVSDVLNTTTGTPDVSSTATTGPFEYSLRRKAVSVVLLVKSHTKGSGNMECGINSSVNG